MKLYPKTSKNLEGLDNMIEYVKKYKGVEIQYFDENGIMSPFDIEKPIVNLMEKCPYIEEITVHPPLSYYDIELIIFKDLNIIKEQLSTLLRLSKKYNIKLNLLYHTQWNIKKHENLDLNIISDLVKMIEGSNVKLLIENLFMFGEDTCSAFDIASRIDSPNLMVCFDICHLYCRANIEKRDVREYASSYLNKEVCKKYIYQVHFSDTKDNDGYVDHKKTHGRVHESFSSVLSDFNILREYNMDKCNYITEISEENYSKREDQIQELKWLEEIE